MTEMINVKLNGKWDLVLPEHRAARPEWVTGWERERLDAMHAVIRPGDTIIDVGAEEGDMSALCALWAGSTGGMILVEPNPKVWPNIRAIWEANAGLAPVRDWFVGFAAADTMLFPVHDDVSNQAVIMHGWPECAYGPLIGDHGFRHLAQQADATPRIDLDFLVRLFAAGSGRTVDVITMDVEGAEYEVLKGAREVLTEQRPVVFVSVHPEFMRDLYQTHPDELHAFMQALGYRSHLLATDHEQHWQFTHRDSQ